MVAPRGVGVIPGVTGLAYFGGTKLDLVYESLCSLVSSQWPDSAADRPWRSNEANRRCVTKFEPEARIMREAVGQLGVRDFDFLVGAWNVSNRRLARRLEGSTEWHEFPGTSECRLILDGRGNIDEIAAPMRDLCGMT